MTVNRDRREELREVANETGHGPVGLDTFNDPDPNLSGDELRALLDMADERDRYRAMLREARRGYLKDGTIFAREVDAALEGKNDD